MKNEPLKGKDSDGYDVNHNERYFWDEDIKSAVEWLKEEDYKIYQDIGKILKNINPGLFTKVAGKLIILQSNRNKAFEDVTQSRQKKR